MSPGAAGGHGGGVHQRKSGGGSVRCPNDARLGSGLFRSCHWGRDHAPSFHDLRVTFGLLAAIYYPVYELAAWSWSRYQESQHLIAEARDRRGRLEQTLQDLQHANRQLSLDNQRMAALRTIADEAQRNKAAFVARVSHEFRAPLNMIIGLAGLMVDRPEVYAEELPPDLSADLEVIRRNSTVGRNDQRCVDLSQTEMGHLTLHREAVDLAEVVAEASQAVSPLIHKKGLRLEHDLPPGPLAVYCDRTRIRQVLLNLLSNAARFTENGSVTVAVSSSEDEVVVEVKDTGPGISPHALSHIFEPVYRAPATSQNVTGGNEGLGLSISREIVHHHGGRIWVESESGQGTHFYFSLPTRRRRWHPQLGPVTRLSKTGSGMRAASIPKLPLGELICHAHWSSCTIPRTHSFARFGPRRRISRLS